MLEFFEIDKNMKICQMREWQNKGMIELGNDTTSALFKNLVYQIRSQQLKKKTFLGFSWAVQIQYFWTHCFPGQSPQHLLGGVLKALLGCPSPLKIIGLFVPVFKSAAPFHNPTVAPKTRSAPQQQQAGKKPIANKRQKFEFIPLKAQNAFAGTSLVVSQKVCSGPLKTEPMPLQFFFA